MIQQMLAIWSQVPLPFLKPAWTSGSFQFTYCWSLAWRILSITLLACESESEVSQSCLTLCNPIDCSPPDSSVHGILQARILQWVAISFSRGSSRPRDRTRVSHIAGTSMWDECNCAVVWAFFGIAFLSENWSFPVLWPLLRFPDLLAYWVQHFHSTIGELQK